MGLIRASIHMAVAAAHVAKPAEVELQHLQAALALEGDAKAVLSWQVRLQQPNHHTADFERWLGALEQEDSLFPPIEPSDWLP